MRCMRYFSFLRYKLISFLLSIFFGYFAVLFIEYVRLYSWNSRGPPDCASTRSLDVATESSIPLQPLQAPQGGPPPRRLLLVGVMTAAKYLDSRAIAVYRTWGRNVPGRIMFFSSASSKSDHPDLPLVALPGVDDAYPPQKKSFLMLKYMFDRFLDDYEWFMRADDDVYVRTDKLEYFLASLNSSKPLFIGQAGLGTKEEFGLLNLAPGENFCMGGPGIIISRAALRLMAPNIRYCLKHLLSTHEDVEIGRCIQRFAGVSCAWSYEMQTIFYNNQSGLTAFTGDLHVTEVHRAITLHPVKTSQHLHRIHNYYTANTLANVHQEILQLSREIHGMNTLLEQQDQAEKGISDALLHPPSLTRFRPQSADELLIWEFFTKSHYSHAEYNPKRGLRSSQKWAVNNLVMQLMEQINQYSQQRGRVIDFRELLYGYQRLDPLHGVHYVLDVHLVYKRYSGKKMTAPVRRHAYLEQAFAWREMSEEEDCVGEDRAAGSAELKSGSVLRYFSPMRVAGTELDTSDPLCAKRTTPQPINMIVPLSGRPEVFQRFVNHLIPLLSNSPTALSLTVMNFPSGTEETVETTVARIVNDFRRECPQCRVELVNVDGNFSRAVALQRGSERFAAEELLFFVDVDMVFTEGFLERLRLNTKMGRMVYFPVVFSQYRPEKWPDHENTDPFHLNEDSGYWRQFGYGIVSCYKGDLERVGGFPLDIQGWGKEDVELYERFIQYSQQNPNFHVFRAADPHLVHVYHDMHCDPNLEATQLVMCRGSMAASLASQRKLAEVVLRRWGVG